MFWKGLSSDPDFVPATMKVKTYSHYKVPSKNTAAAIDAVASDDESSDEDDEDELEVELAVIVSYEGSLFP